MLDSVSMIANVTSRLVGIRNVYKKAFLQGGMKGNLFIQFSHPLHFWSHCGGRNSSFADPIP